MKRTALQHTKMKRLMRALDVPLYVAVGIMESLWNLTARETPTGQIGKLSKEDIAMQIDWRGDPEVLIQALLLSEWLEVDHELRLIVHDWHEHADDAVDNQLARKGERYANGEAPRMNRLSVKEKGELNARFYVEGNGCAHSVRTVCALPEPLPEPEPSPKEKQKPRTAFVPPEWVPLASWAAFVEMRKVMRVPLTGEACRLTVLDLERLAKAGHDPGECLEQSVKKGWRGVFELKRESNGHHLPSNPGVYHGPQMTEAQIEEARKSIEAKRNGAVSPLQQMPQRNGDRGS